MKLATTTADFERFCPTIKEQIAHVAAAGFKHIDLNLYEPRRYPELFYNDGWRDEAKALKEYCDSIGVDLTQSHSPNVNFLAPSGIERMIEDTIRCIEICGELGIPNTVVHPGYSLDLTDDKKDEWFRQNAEHFKKLLPTAEKCGVEVLIENSTKANMGPRYFTNSGADMVEFCEYVGHPLIKCCWDTGHANCEGSQYEHLITLGKKLSAVHFNDNRGGQDEHLIPYLGTMNIDDVMHGLIDSGFEGYLPFEACSSLRSFSYWLGHRRDTALEKKLSEPTLAMQDAAEKLLYEVGKHILTTYGIFED